MISILAVISFCHLLNDMVQSLLPAIYPILKTSFHLDFAQIGMITLTYQLTASLLQPVVGGFTDRRPLPYSLPWGMGFTLVGLMLLALASNYGMILIASAVVGIGSAIFHPESSRVARMASGGQHGMAQSVFQVGGNFGSSLGPLLAAFIVLPHGQISIAWFTLIALLAILLLSKVGTWYKHHERTKPIASAVTAHLPTLSRARVRISIGILLALIFSKYIYLASLTSYYQFYLISRFHVSVESAQIHLFLFLRSRSSRNHYWRTHRRPLRPQVRDLVLYSGRAAVHADAALRQPALDRGAQHSCRIHLGVGVFNDCGLRAGTDAGQDRAGRRTLLRLCVWRCRCGRGLSG